ncbi:MAG: membrane protein insertion efficiency factor YidD [Actinomycetota bacterium]
MRRILRTAGAPARAAAIGLIRVYQATLSGWLGGQCRFYPSCSHYAEEAIRARGAFVGLGFAAWRVLRCNPFGAGGIDHPPGAAPYEHVIRTLPRDEATT